MANDQGTVVREVNTSDTRSPADRGEPGVWNPELFAADPERAIAEYLDDAVADVEIQNPMLRPDGGTTYLGVALYETDDDVITVPFSLALDSDGNPLAESPDSDQETLDAPTITIVRKVDDVPALAHMSRTARANPNHAAKLDRGIERLANGVPPGDVRRIPDSDCCEVRWLGAPNSPRLLFRVADGGVVEIWGEVTKNDQDRAIKILREMREK